METMAMATIFLVVVVGAGVWMATSMRKAREKVEFAERERKRNELLEQFRQERAERAKNFARKVSEPNFANAPAPSHGVERQASNVSQLTAQNAARQSAPERRSDPASPTIRHDSISGWMPSYSSDSGSSYSSSSSDCSSSSDSSSSGSDSGSSCSGGE